MREGFRQELLRTSSAMRHANPSMTQDVYMGRKVASTGAAAILEVLG